MESNVPANTHLQLPVEAPSVAVVHVQLWRREGWGRLRPQPLPAHALKERVRLELAKVKGAWSRKEASEAAKSQRRS